jgi:hypothetical protein
MQASLPKANNGAGGGGGVKQEDNDDDELPQPVFDRILRRILVAVGLPMASGVALLNLYESLKNNQVEVPSWLSLLTILVSFGTSALGIAYGTLSASWGPGEGRIAAGNQGGSGQLAGAPGGRDREGEGQSEEEEMIM